MHKILILFSFLLFVGCTKNNQVVEPKSEKLVTIDLVGSPLIASVDEAKIQTFILNIKNMGDEEVSSLPISLSGGQDSAFQLLTSSCPSLLPGGVNECKIRLRFDPKDKANDVYETNLVAGDLVTPLSVTLNVPVVSSNTHDLRLYNQSGEIAPLSLMNVGKASSNSLSKVVSIRHLNRLATNSVPVALIQSNPDFSLNKSSCAKEELNSALGCQVRILFNAGSLGIKTAALRVENHDRLNLQGEKVQSTLDSQVGSSSLSFEKDNAPLSSLTFEGVIVPESKSVVVKIKNSGTGAGSGQLSVSPANVFYVTGNTCKVVAAGSECQFNLRVSSVKKVSGSYQASVSFGSLTLPLQANLIGNDCAASEHVDPVTYQCVGNDQVEVIAGGSRSRSWITTPAPGLWSSWSYACSTHYENVGEECLGVTYTLTLNKSSGGMVSDGEGLICNEGCSQATVSYQYPKTVNLSAVALVSHNLGSFSGDASCAGALCQVVLDGNKTVNYDFNIKQFNLTIIPPVGGSISGAISGVYDYGTSFTLSASSNLGYEFLSFGNDCSGATCSVSLTSDKTVSANFGTVLNSLSIVSSSQNVLKDACSQVVSIEARDINNNLLNRSSSTVIDLSGSDLQFFSNSSCSSSINSVSLVNSGVATVYVKGSVIGSKTISVSSSAYGVSTSQAVSIYDALLISPSSMQIMAGVNKTFTKTGGIGPFVFSKVSGVGSIDSSTGVFSAPSAGVATVQVLDQTTGATSSASITVSSVLSIASGTCTGSSPEQVNCSVTSAGGVGSRSYTSDAGGVINSAGVFYGVCANNTSAMGSSVVTVTDSDSNSQQITLNFPCVFTSCNQVKAELSGVVSGKFWIDTDADRSGLDPTEMYCEHSTSGGGWNLVARYGNTSNNLSHWFVNSYNSLTLDNNFDSNMQIAGYANRLASRSEKLLVKYAGTHTSFFVVGNLTSNKSRLWGSSPGNLELGVMEVRPTSSYTSTNLDVGKVVRLHTGSYNGTSGSGLTAGIASDVTLDAVSIQANYGTYRLPGIGTTPGSAWSLQDNPLMAYVREGYNKLPVGCLDALNRGSLNINGVTGTGVYLIDPDGFNNGAVEYQVYCDMVARTESSVVASGGTVNTYTSGGVGYKSHTFPQGTTNLVVSVATTSASIDALIVAGGGGGGSSGSIYAGGGGAGGMIVTSVVPSVTSYSMVVGAGGPAATNGFNSSAFGQIAIGGGAGASGANASGASGGSGGGGAVASGAPGAGTLNQGNAGGYASPGPADANTGGGGGGGAGGRGYDISLSAKRNNCGPGGAGLQNSFQTGVALWYAAGGSGSGYYYCDPTNGIGGSTPGYIPVAPYTNWSSMPLTGGANGTGSGGGAGRSSAGAPGGSGTVIIRYKFKTF